MGGLGSDKTQLTDFNLVALNRSGDSPPGNLAQVGDGGQGDLLGAGVLNEGPGENV